MTGAGNPDIVPERPVAAQVLLPMTGAGNPDIVPERPVAAQVDVR